MPILLLKWVEQYWRDASDKKAWCDVQYLLTFYFHDLMDVFSWHMVKEEVTVCTNAYWLRGCSIMYVLRWSKMCSPFHVLEYLEATLPFKHVKLGFVSNGVFAIFFAREFNGCSVLRSFHLENQDQLSSNLNYHRTFRGSTMFRSGISWINNAKTVLLCEGSFSCSSKIYRISVVNSRYFTTTNTLLNPFQQRENKVITFH